jgi:hypothetical protein
MIAKYSDEKKYKREIIIGNSISVESSKFIFNLWIKKVLTLVLKIHT